MSSKHTRSRSPSRSRSNSNSSNGSQHDNPLIKEIKKIRAKIEKIFQEQGDLLAKISLYTESTPGKPRGEEYIERYQKLESKKVILEDDLYNLNERLTKGSRGGKSKRKTIRYKNRK